MTEPKAKAEHPRIFLRDADLKDLDWDGAEGDVHAINSPRSIIITYATPYVPEPILAEKVAKARAEEVEHAAYSAGVALKMLDNIGCTMEWFALNPSVKDAKIDRSTITNVMALLSGLVAREAAKGDK